MTALWQQAKTKNQSSSVVDLSEIKSQTAAKKKSALMAHYGNAGVLSVTVIMLVFYFYYLYNIQDVLSKVARRRARPVPGGRVLQGVIKPDQCECFGRECTTRTPMGATMVSSEGACAAYFQYRRIATPASTPVSVEITR